VKTFGIYLAYPPALDLNAQGLGRHLLAFLDEARRFEDVKFVIACPSWTRAPLRKLLDSGGMPLEVFELIGPEKRPSLLSFYEWYLRRRGRKWRPHRVLQILEWVRAGLSRRIVSLERRIVSSRNPIFVGFVGLLAVSGLVLSWSVPSILGALTRSMSLGRRAMRSVRFRLAKSVAQVVSAPQSSRRVLRLYNLMEEVEIDILLRDINNRKDVLAWYCPTAFWPHFNLVDAPRLTCVPDVVLSEFPVGFAAINGDRFLKVFRDVEATIKGGDNFITYSETVKNQTLVRRYHVNPSSITVVQHGANRLDKAVVVSGFSDNNGATNALCRGLMRTALHKAASGASVSYFNPDSTKFIFYASQFRPNKNIISLLRAYEFLLRRRYVGHKLVLTGNPDNLPEIAHYIRDHNLQTDVVCLQGLSERELAACYRLADLAVNPSLSEGGCPFTFTEALSVGTPVVMARIAVTEEVLTDPDLQELMLFDPYSWKNMAERIEWALSNLEVLRERQEAVYERLAQRSWRAVVGEHIAVLDRISFGGPSAKEPELGLRKR
jgi:glycosyltransferase involved in cell wall biosynthesis